MRSSPSQKWYLVSLNQSSNSDRSPVIQASPLITSPTAPSLWVVSSWLGWKWPEQYSWDYDGMLTLTLQCDAGYAAVVDETVQCSVYGRWTLLPESCISGLVVLTNRLVWSLFFQHIKSNTNPCVEICDAIPAPIEPMVTMPPGLITPDSLLALDCGDSEDRFVQCNADGSWPLDNCPDMAGTCPSLVAPSEMSISCTADVPTFSDSCTVW